MFNTSVVKHKGNFTVQYQAWSSQKEYRNKCNDEHFIFNFTFNTTLVSIYKETLSTLLNQFQWHPIFIIISLNSFLKNVNFFFNLLCVYFYFIIIIFFTLQYSIGFAIHQKGIHLYIHIERRVEYCCLTYLNCLLLRTSFPKCTDWDLVDRYTYSVLLSKWLAIGFTQNYLSISSDQKRIAESISFIYTKWIPHSRDSPK